MTDFSNILITNTKEMFVACLSFAILLTGIGLCMGLWFHGFKIIEVNVNSNNRLKEKEDDISIFRRIRKGKIKKKGIK